MKRAVGVRVVVLVIVSFVAAPLAAWWLVGDLSETRTRPDYTWRAPKFDPGVVRICGLAAAVSLAICVVLLVQWTRQRLVSRSWWSVEGPVLFAGLALGYSLRVLTAGTVGANIGGGLVLLAWPPMFLVVLVWSVARSVSLLNSSAGAPNAQARRW